MKPTNLASFLLLLSVIAIMSRNRISTASHMPLAHVSFFFLASSARSSAVAFMNDFQALHRISKANEDRQTLTHGWQSRQRRVATEDDHDEYNLKETKKGETDKFMVTAKNKGRSSIDSRIQERRNALLRENKRRITSSRTSVISGSAGNKWSRSKSSPSRSSAASPAGNILPQFGIQVTRERELEDAMIDLDSWSLDVFKIDELSGGRPLTVIGYTIFQERNLTAQFNIPPKTLLSFLMAVEDHYRRANPYHNAIHAADVMQAVHVLLQAPPIESTLTSLEILAAVTAAAIHDVDHPGLTNQYLIETGSELAILYNDRSVLENHHLAFAFKLLQDPNMNIFGNLLKKQRATVRKMIIDMVLATDMARHLSILDDLKQLVANPKVTACSGEVTLSTYSEKILVLESILHGSDVSNPTKPLRLHEQWATRITEEFYLQGEKQKRQGLLEAYTMHSTDKSTIAKSQVQFIDGLVSPLWKALADLLHPHAEDMLENLEANRDHYAAQMSGEAGDATCD